MLPDALQLRQRAAREGDKKRTGVENERALHAVGEGPSSCCVRTASFVAAGSFRSPQDRRHLSVGGGNKRNSPRVDLDTHVHEVGKVGGKLLRAQANVLRRDPGGNGAADLCGSRVWTVVVV